MPRSESVKLLKNDTSIHLFSFLVMQVDPRHCSSTVHPGRALSSGRGERKRKVKEEQRERNWAAEEGKGKAGADFSRL